MAGVAGQFAIDDAPSLELSKGSIGIRAGYRWAETVSISMPVSASA